MTFSNGTKLSIVADRLHGTLRTRQGDFTGFVQWDRKKCVGADELNGHTAAGELGLRFDAIRSIAATRARPSHALPVRQSSALPAASFRSHLAVDTLAVRLAVPLTGPAEDFPLLRHFQGVRPAGRTN